MDFYGKVVVMIRMSGLSLAWHRHGLVVLEHGYSHGEDCAFMGVPR